MPILHALIVGTANATRSIMTEAILRHRGSQRMAAHSAGTNHTSIDGRALRVLQEAGIDTSGLYAKGVSEVLGRRHFHYVLIVCPRAKLAFPFQDPVATETIYAPFSDPAAAEGAEADQVAVFRTVRDQIDESVQRWLSGGYMDA